MHKDTRTYIRIGVIAAVFILIIKYFQQLLGLLALLLHAAAPLITGCVIAYALNLLMKFLERHLYHDATGVKTAFWERFRFFSRFKKNKPQKLNAGASAKENAIGKNAAGENTADENIARKNTADSNAAGKSGTDKNSPGKSIYTVSEAMRPPKAMRPVCILMSLLLLLLAAALLVQIVVPELVSSFKLIGRELPVVGEKIRQWLLSHSQSIPTMQGYLKKMDINWGSIAEKLFNFFSASAGGVLSSIITAISAFFGTAMNILIGFAFAIYLLYNKEKLLRQFQKLIFAWMKQKNAERLILVAQTAHKTFSSFIVGQFTEAVILGLLCTVGMMLFRFPYAAMTGAVVGVTALIPIVGAYIGAVVGAFMILTVSPLQAALFVLFLVVLQQLEGNLIYPRVVGTSIGLPGMWVLAAITVGGSLLGIPGMLLGVPTAATVYKLLGFSVNERLKKVLAETPPS